MSAARVDERERIRFDAADAAPAIGFLRRLREGLDAGLDLPEAAARGAAGLPGGARDAVRRAARRRAGGYDEDDWGLDEEFVELVFPFFEFLYDRWWRVETSGVVHVPSHGRALLAANHAGILPWDGTMLSFAIQREHPLPRYPRFLVLNWAFDLPVISVAMRKVGGVVASPYNAFQLLEEDELVAVFPEGVKGAGKPFRERYRLQRFGRGGFVEIALRTRAPIVPVAIVGSEEIYPKLGDAPAVGRLLGAPYFPLTPTFPWLGPLGAVPLPSKWRIEFCEPIPIADYGPNAADDRSLVFELSERVRETIQQKLYENLVKRGSAFL
ncbi:MAG TPA: lysophospholipid acyltransferase family protein [Thermoleophilaceae bacterium]|nr:lysophospholipid acyltransferase family protein [Thermoleophilaceae bacterium]